MNAVKIILGRDGVLSSAGVKVVHHYEDCTDRVTAMQEGVRLGERLFSEGWTHFYDGLKSHFLDRKPRPLLRNEVKFNLDTGEGAVLVATWGEFCEMVRLDDNNVDKAKDAAVERLNRKVLAAWKAIKRLQV